MPRTAHLLCVKLAGILDLRRNTIIADPPHNLQGMRRMGGSPFGIPLGPRDFVVAAAFRRQQ